MKSISDACDEVVDREDLVRFIEQLVGEYRSGYFENDRLDLYLEALCGWTDDMDGVFAWQGSGTPEQPTWNLIARMLLAATAYD